MKDLIEKLEQTEVGSRELDCLLATLVGGFTVKGELYGEPAFCRQDEDGSWNHPGQSGAQMVPRYTTSLDAALALAERVLPGWRVYGISDETDFQSYMGWGAGLSERRGPGIEHVRAATPALALCAAVLRAQSEARV